MDPSFHSILHHWGTWQGFLTLTGQVRPLWLLGPLSTHASQTPRAPSPAHILSPGVTASWASPSGASAAQTHRIQCQTYHHPVNLAFTDGWPRQKAVPLSSLVSLAGPSPPQPRPLLYLSVPLSSLYTFILLPFSPMIFPPGRLTIPSCPG